MRETYESISSDDCSGFDNVGLTAKRGIFEFDFCLNILSWFGHYEGLSYGEHENQNHCAKNHH